MKVREIMTRSVDVIGPETKIPDAAARMGAERADVLPVGDDDRLLGTVSNRDIGVRVVAEDRMPEATSVRDVMTCHGAYCFEDDPVHQAAALMTMHRIRQIPVLNREKQVVGTVMLAAIEETGGGASEIVENMARGISTPTD